MTPYRSAAGGSHESNFNSKHAKARNIVERTIGVLKLRFRCLLGACELHYGPNKASHIANVCVALHNMCIQFRTELSEDIDNIIEQERTFNKGHEELADTDYAATQIRNNLRDNLV